VVTGQTIKKTRRHDQREAERSWVDLIVTMGEHVRPMLEQCTPGYYNNEGTVSLKAARSSFYPGSSVELMKMLRERQQTENFDGLELTYD